MFAPNYQSNEEWNGKRLEIRRKLESYGKTARETVAAQGVDWDVRTSLHHPFEFNGFRVSKQWMYCMRGKKEKTALKKILGAELGKDLDSSFRNLHFALTIDESSLEIALRIYPEAWYDGQNLKNKCADDERRKEFAGLLQKARGFEYRIHDWKNFHNAAEASAEKLKEFFRYYVPGEHRWTLFHTISREDPLATSGEFVDVFLESAKIVGQIYRFACWSPQNNYLNLKV